MRDGGMQKAQIAVKVLVQKSATDAEIAAGIAATPDGVKVLLQTALLHPEPSMREGAITVIAHCVEKNNAAFIDAALSRGPASLPAALVRMCAESDRKVKAAVDEATEDDADSERPRAVDPDLVARQIAVGCFANLLTTVDIDFSIRVLGGEWDGAAGTWYVLLSNSNAIIRRRAVSLLRELLAPVADSALDGGEAEEESTLVDDKAREATDAAAVAASKQTQRAELLIAFAGEAPGKVAESLTSALASEEEEARSTALSVLRLLRSSPVVQAERETVREALVEAGALEALDADVLREAEPEDVIKWLRAT